MAKRKYFTEFGVNMFGTWKFLLQQDGLEDPRLSELLPEGDTLHIYMICRRPRIAWAPETLRFDKNHFSGVFTVQCGSKFERHEFNAGHPFGTDQLTISCPYPHTECAIFDSAGKNIAGGKVPLMLGGFGPEYWEFLDLEVLYVGQSYGEDGSRVAPDRLKSHSTLQGIYAEAMRRSPDKDIWIMLWSFEPLLLTSFGGNFDSTQTTPTQDEEHANHVWQSCVTEQQQINFTEAALIRYFRPEYNKVLKDTFPNPAHKTYSQCYDLDLNAVHVELQTEDVSVRLWSPSVPATWVHFASFDLHSREDRKGMFEVF